MAQMSKGHVIPLTTGDLKTGMTAARQSVGLVHDLPAIDELMQRLVAEIHATQSRLSRGIND